MSIFSITSHWIFKRAYARLEKDIDKCLFANGQQIKWTVVSQREGQSFRTRAYGSLIWTRRCACLCFFFAIHILQPYSNIHIYIHTYICTLIPAMTVPQIIGGCKSEKIRPAFIQSPRINKPWNAKTRTSSKLRWIFNLTLK